MKLRSTFWSGSAGVATLAALALVTPACSGAPMSEEAPSAETSALARREAYFAAASATRSMDDPATKRDIESLRREIEKVLAGLEQAKVEMRIALAEFRDEEWLRRYAAYAERFKDYAVLMRNEPGLLSFTQEGYEIHEQLLGIMKNGSETSAVAVVNATNLLALTQAVALVDLYGGDRARAREWIKKTLEADERVLFVPPFPDGWQHPETCWTVTDLFSNVRDARGILYHQSRAHYAGYHGGRNGEFRFYPNGSGRPNVSCFEFNAENKRVIKPTLRAMWEASVQAVEANTTYAPAAYARDLLKSF